MPAGENLTLLTDLYQLTMAQAYFRAGRMAPASFSLFIRNYPPERGYLVAAGLEDVLDYLERF
jgi:nicotinate phosphoribosyltransferase